MCFGRVKYDLYCMLKNCLFLGAPRPKRSIDIYGERRWRERKILIVDNNTGTKKVPEKGTKSNWYVPIGMYCFLKFRKAYLPIGMHIFSKFRKAYVPIGMHVFSKFLNWNLNWYVHPLPHP